MRSDNGDLEKSLAEPQLPSPSAPQALGRSPQSSRSASQSPTGRVQMTGRDQELRGRRSEECLNTEMQGAGVFCLEPEEDEGLSGHRRAVEELRRERRGGEGEQMDASGEVAGPRPSCSKDSADFKSSKWSHRPSVPATPESTSIPVVEATLTLSISRACSTNSASSGSHKPLLAGIKGSQEDSVDASCAITRPTSVSGNNVMDLLGPRRKHSSLATGEFSLSLEEVYNSWCTQRPGDYMDKKRHQSFKKISSTKSWKLFTSQSPMSSLITTRWCQMIMYIILFYFTYRAVAAHAEWMEATTATMRVFRVTSLSTREHPPEHTRGRRNHAERPPSGRLHGAMSNHSGGGMSNTSTGPGLMDWGVLVNNCPFQVEGQVSWKDGQTWVQDFNASVKVNGFWVQTNFDHPELDPLDFQIEGSLDGVSWKMLAKNSGCRQVSGARTTPLFSTERHTTQLFDFARLDCTWPQLVVWSWSYPCGIAGALCCALAGAQGLGRTATLFFAAGMLGTAVMQTVGVMGYFSQGLGLRSAQVFGAIAGNTLFAGGIIFNEARAMELLALSAVIVQLAFILDSALQVDVTPETDFYPFGHAAMMLVSLVLISKREMMRQSAWVCVSKDYETMCREYKEMTKQPQVISHLDAIEKMVLAWETREKGSETASPMQLVGTVIACHGLIYGRKSPLFQSFAGNFHKVEKVGNLDQLYHAAVLVQPVFRRKLQQWALLSRGYFPIQANSGAHVLILWEAAQRMQLEHQVKFTPLKPLERSLDKLASSYCNDVSMLLDVTRDMLVFSNLQDLSSCFASILQDAEVEILRIRNRLNPQYDGKRTAGWRDLNLILRFKTDETRRLGVDRHCCEVLLTTKSFIKCRSDTQHSRYLRYRDCRYYTSSWFSAAFMKITGRNRKSKFLSQRLFSPDVSVRMKGSDSPKMLDTKIIPTLLDDEGDNEPTSFATSEESIDRLSVRVDPPRSGFSRPASVVEAFEEQQSLTQQEKIEDTSRIIETIILQRCIWPSNILGLMLAKCRHGFAMAKLSNVLYTKRPITAALSKPAVWFVLVLLVLITVAVRLSDPLLDFLAGYSFKGRHFKLVGNSCGDRACNMTEAVMAGTRFGMLGSKCSAAGQNAELRASEGEVVVSYPHSLNVNGWFYEATTNSSVLLTNNFRLEVSDDANHWQIISKGPCSTFMNRTITRPATCVGANFSIVGSSGARQYMFDSPIYFRLCDAGVWAFCAGSVGAVLLAARDRPAMSRHMFGGGILICGCLFMIAAWIEAVKVQDKSNDSSSTRFLWGLSYLGLGLSVEQEIGFPYSLFGFIIATAWISIYQNVVVQGEIDPFAEASKPGRWLLLVTMAALSVVVCALRSLDSRRRNLIVSDDKNRYDLVWQNLQNSQPDKIVLLEDALLRIHQSSTDARQYVKRSTTSASALFVRSFRLAETAGRIDGSGKAPIVGNLDQLYAAAAVIHLFLRRKVQIWAEAANGSFPITGPEDECVRWADVKTDKDVLPLIKWTSLKAVDRAIEKIARTYNDDVSRLCDISRETVVFDQMDDLVKCVHAISHDLEVEVIRCKNRLSSGYDSWQTAGFRSVQFNLRIVNDETKRLGIDAHICELQLHLMSFWKCKTAVGHAKYVDWRNSRVM